jgi:vacuolar-type H+-ATPase subunit I/STV1
MWVFSDYQWLYRSLMIITIIIGILCAWSVMGLIRGGKNAFRNAVILLVVGSIVAGIQYYYSLEIRGKATPANVKFFSNFGPLLFFLALRLPGIRDRVDFSYSGTGSVRSAAGGLAAIVAGILVITTSIWAGPSHTFDGVNLVHVLRIPLLAGGATLSMGGIALLLWTALDISFPRTIQQSVEDK